MKSTCLCSLLLIFRLMLDPNINQLQFRDTTVATVAATETATLLATSSTIVSKAIVVKTVVARVVVLGSHHTLG